jgi:hypothetical protein
MACLADDRPIGGSIGVTKWGSIFTENYIFNPVKGDSKFPNADEFPARM